MGMMLKLEEEDVVTVNRETLLSGELVLWDQKLCAMLVVSLQENKDLT